MTFRGKSKGKNKEKWVRDLYEEISKKKDKCVKMVRDIHGNVKVHETRSQAHAASAEEEEKGGGKKRKGEKKGNEAEGGHKNIAEQSHKKGKAEKEEEKDDNGNGKSAADIAKEFEEFCKATSEHLSMKQMREILEANGQGPVSDDAVVPKWYKVFFNSHHKRVADLLY